MWRRSNGVRFDVTEIVEPEAGGKVVGTVQGSLEGHNGCLFGGRK
jgi:hypothetical protein